LDHSNDDTISSRRRSFGFLLGLKQRLSGTSPPIYQEKAAELPGGNMKSSPLEMDRSEAGGRIIEGPDDFGQIWTSSELPGGAPEPAPSELDNASVRVAGTDAGLQTVKGEEGLQTVKGEEGLQTVKGEGGPSKANLAAGGQRQRQRQSHALSFMEYQED
jgi:hypothetical protein